MPKLDKTIHISTDTWKTLTKLKINFEQFKTIDDVIKHLLKRGEKKC